MDATILQPYTILFPPPPRFGRRFAMQNHLGRRRCSPIKSVITDNNNLATSSTHDQSKNVYNDSWFDRLAINHLSNSLQSATGLISKKSGYDGLVEAATMASRQFNPIQQRELVILSLQTAFPRPILSLIKRVLPPSKFARQYFAAFTTVFFAWLVGPCQVRESEFGGKREKNVVHIPKCRFLEETNCVGMCTNLCKMPSQTFIKDSLGMPINMVPSMVTHDFDDMSCEMIFGEEPPPPALDPAFKQPCFKHCKAIKEHKRNCTN